ncbi:hypothetical protein LSCM4_00151 [Leishmania orientalis]|uniref:Uncharacterized protein n=1 Tax=Leishmania orientalis TaxID=2249476 RepID=A0A836GU12_9TRYP|nr:hypothetical protein LSCM4_00151 [Leishmania orientalis]
MFFRRNASVKESAMSREKVAEKAGFRFKKDPSEAAAKVDSGLGSASLHKSTTSSAGRADVVKDTEQSSAGPAPECAAGSQRAVSAHLEEAAKSTVQSASSHPPSRSRPVNLTPVTLAASSAGEKSEDGRAVIPIYPVPTTKRSTSPTPGISLPAAEGAAHSRVASGLSATAVESIVFSGSESLAGTSIQFAFDSASPERAMSVEASHCSRIHCDVKRNKSCHIGAQRSPLGLKAADHPMGAVSSLTSQSSLDIHIEDDELAQEAPVKVVAAAVRNEAPQSETQPSESPYMPTSGSSKPVSSGGKRAALDKGSEIVGDPTHCVTYPAALVGQPLEGGGTDRVCKAAGPSEARPARASEDDARPSHASNQNTQKLDTVQQCLPSPRGRDLMDSAPPCSRSQSVGSVDHRESRESAGQESAELPPRRDRQRWRRRRLIPAGEDPEDWSGEFAQRALEGGAFRYHRDAAVDTGERGYSIHARGEKANGHSRRTDPSRSKADYYSDRELSGREHRHLLSRRPVRCADSQPITLENLDGGALVRQCLMEVMKDDRESAQSWHRPRHRRRSSEAVQRRSLMQHIYNREGERYLPLHESVSPASSVSPVERHRKDDGDDDTSGDENRARSRRCRSNGAPLHHRWRVHAEREARPTPPLCADSVRSHRISFYDDDTDHDLYAASAVTRSEELRALPYRSRVRRSRGGEDDRYRSATGRSAGLAVSNSSSNGDVEYEDELRPYPTAHHVRRNNRHDREDAGLSPWAKERRTDSRRRSMAEEQEQSRYHYEGHQASELRGSEWMHRRRGCNLDFDDDYSRVLRRRDPLDGDDHSGRSRSRSCRTPRTLAPPAYVSPRRFHRGTYREDLNGEVQPGTVGCPSLVSPASSPVRGRRARRAASTKERTPLRRASRNRTSSVGSAPLSEKELLDEVEWKLDVLEQQIADEDVERERAMMRSPFERLYHLNNRRDRDERRKKVFQLNRLERIRDQLISGSLEEALARKEERLRKQQEMLTSPNGVFMRLYHSSSPRRSSADVVSTAEDSGDKSAREGNGSSRASVNATADPTAASGQSASMAVSRMSEAEWQALGKRLHERAAATKRKKEEMAKQRLEEREQRQAEELLIARLAWQIQLDRSRSRGSVTRRPQTPAQLEEEARAELKKLRKEDPTGYEKKVLQGRVLSEAERDMHAMRLSQQGYLSKMKLEARKRVLELKNCTFHPIINEFPGSAQVSTHDYTHSRDGHEHSGGGTDDEEHSKVGTHRARPHHEVNRFAILYRKGMQAKERGEALRDQRDREARLKILRSRMASDHHFRRRVELDPSLAERFMKSLVV